MLCRGELVDGLMVMAFTDNISELGRMGKIIYFHSILITISHISVYELTRREF